MFAEFPTIHRTEFSWQDCDAYLFASEIAWRHMIDNGCESLDTILADPALAEQFDRIAQAWSPSFTPLEYRWAALKLRKSAKTVRSRARLLADALLSKPVTVASAALKKLPNVSGIYVIVGSEHQTLYAGETNNIRERVLKQVGSKTKRLWQAFSDPVAARFFATDCTYSTRLAHQWRLVTHHQPPLNLPNQKIA
jgi:site-specific DNA-methyltransferase (adenine-specific)